MGSGLEIRVLSCREGSGMLRSMGSRRAPDRTARFVILVPILSVLSALFAAACFGAATFGFMGLWVFPIYTVMKGYIFFPVVMAFYAIAGLKAETTAMAPRKYCLVLSVGASIAFAIAGVVMLREVDPVSILGTLVGGFVPAYFSLWLLLERNAYPTTRPTPTPPRVGPGREGGDRPS